MQATIESNQLKATREGLLDDLLQAALAEDRDATTVLAKTIKSFDDALGIPPAQMQSPNNHNEISGSIQNSTLDNVATEEHRFYRERDRVVRMGMKKDGTGEYRTSFSRKNLEAFLASLRTIDPDQEFQMNAGLVENLQKGVSRDQAYVVRSWLVAGGLVEEEARNLYRLTTDSIDTDAELLWERTPFLRARVSSGTSA